MKNRYKQSSRYVFESLQHATLPRVTSIVGVFPVSFPKYLGHLFSVRTIFSQLPPLKKNKNKNKIKKKKFLLLTLLTYRHLVKLHNETRD